MPVLRQQFAQNWTESVECLTVKAAAIDALETGKPRLGLLFDNGCKDLVTLHVTEAIATYVSMLPANRGVAPDAVIAMGKAFVDLPEARHLTLSELKTFLAMAFKRQTYGKLYGGFGYDTLMEWFNSYMEDRYRAVIDYREAQHNQITAREKTRRDRQDGDAWGSNHIGEIWPKNQ